MVQLEVVLTLTLELITDLVRVEVLKHQEVLILEGFTEKQQQMQLE